MVRVFELVRFFALFFVLSIIAPASQALAAGDKVWVFSEGNDASNRGRMTARLAYRVPQTDNIQVDGVCEARASSSISTASLILGADTGSLKEGASVKVRFSGGGFERTINGLVFGTELEVGVSGVSMDIDVKDPLWNALTTKVTLDYQVPGYSSSRLKLVKGHAKIRQFIRACRDYANALGTSAQAKPEPVKTADAKPKPKTPAPVQAASSDTSQKDAFNSAKELGTLEAWEAFLTSFPTGFRAELAGAYLKRLGGSAPKAPVASAPITQTPPPVVETAIAPSPPAATPADISISTTANQTSCKGGDSCSYTVVATNNGGEAFVGELVIANSLAPRGATLTSPGNAPWFCQSMGGGAVCSNPAANIAPGASTNLSLTFKLPRRAGGSVTSCASISWGGAPTASTVRDVQQALNDQGHNVGRPDGQAGRKTKSAIRAYQQQNGLQETGEVDLPLLIAMFTVPGSGDGDPINDQSCTGSSVIPAQTSFIPQPQVSYCGGGRVLDPAGRCACPATFPHWTGKSCLPRRVRNCRGGTYYNKRQKLCLCPSRKPFWHGNRCHTKPLPIPPAGSDGHLLNKQQAGCPSTHIRIGNVCVNLGIVPVFGNRGGGGRGGRGGGGGTAILPGGGAGGQQAGTGGGKKSKGGKRGGPKTQTTGAKTCGIGVKVTPGSCACPTGSVFSNKSNSCFVPAKAKQRPKCPLNAVFNNVNNCESQAGVSCRGGAGVPGGGTICHVNGSAAQKAWLKKAGQKAGTKSGTRKCINNMVMQSNGVCGCPANLPVKNNSFCVRPLPYCNPGKVYGTGQCRCALGYTKKAATGGVQCVKTRALKKGEKDPFNCGDGRRSDNPTGRCLCPAGLNFIVDSCVQITPAKKFKGKTLCPRGTTIRPGSQDRGATGICIPIAKAQQLKGILKKRKQLQQKQKPTGCLPTHILSGGSCVLKPLLLTPAEKAAAKKASQQAAQQRAAQQAAQKKAAQQKAAQQKKTVTPRPICNPSIINLTGSCKCGSGFTQKSASGGIQCIRTGPSKKGARDPFDCGDGRRKDNPTGRCLCPSNLSFIGGSCVQATQGQFKGGQITCPQGMTILPGSRDRGGPGTCIPKAKAQQLQLQPKQQLTGCRPTHQLIGRFCVLKPQGPTPAQKAAQQKAAQQKAAQQAAQQKAAQQAAQQKAAQQAAQQKAAQQAGQQKAAQQKAAQQKAAQQAAQQKAAQQAAQQKAAQQAAQQKAAQQKAAQQAAQQKAAQQAAQQKAAQQAAQQKSAQQKAAQQAAQQKAAQQAAQQKAAQQAAQQKAAQQAAQQRAAQQKAAQQAAQAKAVAAAKAKAEAAAAAANTLRLRQQLQQQGQQPAPPPPAQSDIRLKRDVVHLTTLGSGIKLYSFRYLWSDESHVGVMAQDLLLDPAYSDTVILQTSGYYAVDYAMLGLRMVTLDEWKSQGVASVLLNSPLSAFSVLSPVVQGNR